MSSAVATPISQKSIKKLLFCVVAVVAISVLATPADAGFGCPDSQACSNYCRTINRNGGYCGGVLWHTCYCNQS
ncbi:hypothetical protein FBU30_009751 [Linnemannia zychae]|nr:hypothetical protein FBU30_009751 [Linnemannia zychae]